MAKKEQKRARQKFIRRGRGELQDTREIALALNESPFTVRDWRNKGIIPFLKLGHRQIRYRLPDVIRALEKFTVKAK